jgi:hypothetical protein
MRVNGAIIRRVRISRSGSSIGILGSTAEEKMTCSTRSGFRLGKVGHVTMNV